MDNKTIGANIKKYRLKNNIRQSDLAEKTGLSVNYIGMIERGEKIPSLDTFIDILNVLNISSAAVLNDVVNNDLVFKVSSLNDKLEVLPIEYQKKVLEILDAIIKIL